MLPILSSFSSEALARARDVSPASAARLAGRQGSGGLDVLLRELGCVALHCDHKHLDEASATEIRAAGYAILVYTVNETAVAGGFGWPVDCVVTDALDRIGPAF